MSSITMLAVVGSRNYHNFNMIEEKLLEWEREHGEITTVISGGATGVDHLAELFAKKYQKGMIVFPPDYTKYAGKIAPLMRNTQIVETADFLVAFPSKDSRGTWDTVAKAKKKGIHVTICQL